MSYVKQPLMLRTVAARRESNALLVVPVTCLLLASVPTQAQTGAETTVSQNQLKLKKPEVTELEGVTAHAQKRPAGSNPNANPAAPYKIERSGNTKLTEPLRNISKTIIVVGKEQLADTNTTALKDLMRTQAGITLGTGEGGNAQGDRFIIRGFEARGDIFVDGLRDPGVVTREVFTAEQIEIAKGASSTFAGRGTTGGAVNSVSKKPQASNFGKATAIIGHDKRASLDVNRALNDKLSVRGNLMWQDSDIAGRDEVFDKRHGAALAADYRFNDKVEFLVDYYHLRTDQMPDRGHPWDTFTNKPADVNRDNFYGIVGRDFQETGADVLTGTLDIKLSDQTQLSSKTRTGKTTNNYIVSTPSNWTPRGQAAQALSATSTMTNRASTAGFINKSVANNTQLSHEFHLGAVEHHVVGGVEWSEEKVTNQGYVLNTYDATTNPTGIPAPALNVMNPNNHASAPQIKGRAENTSKVNGKVQSFYLMDTAKLNPQWEAFGGIRHDLFEIERQAREGTYDVNSDSKDTTNFVNGHVGVVYKPRENGSIYGSVSSSSNLPGEMYDSGGVDYGGITPLVAALKKPEKNKTTEIGTKWDVANNKLALTAALFQTDKKNKIEVTGTGATQVASQTGAIRVKGLELGATGNASEKLSLSAGAVLMDTEVTDSTLSSNIGKKLANVAEKSASFNAKYQLTPQLAVGGGAVYTGVIRAGTFAANVQNNGSNVELPSSKRLDLMAEYKVAKNLTAQLNVKNVADATIYEALYRSPSPFVYVAPGRTINVGLSYDF